MVIKLKKLLLKWVLRLLLPKGYTIFIFKTSLDKEQIEDVQDFVRYSVQFKKEMTQRIMENMH